MSDIWKLISSAPSFVFAVLQVWQAYVTGGVLVAISSVWERWKGKTIPWRRYRLGVIGFLLVSFYFVWYDQRTLTDKEHQASAEAQRALDGLRLELQNRDKEISLLHQQIQDTTESPDSLRRRTVHLADVIAAFLEERQASHPPYTNREKDVSPEQKAINDASVKYDDETQRLCLQRFKEELGGIPRELRSKGLDVKYLDQMAQPRCLYGDEIEFLRSLAYRLDGHDRPVHF
jgi:hypothetical protein